MKRLATILTSLSRLVGRAFPLIGLGVFATAAGLGPAYNVSDGFEGGLDSDGHRMVTGWKAVGLPWRQG